MAKRSELEIGAEWAVNRYNDYLTKLWERMQTTKVRIEKTTPVLERRHRRQGEPTWVNWEKGSGVLVRAVLQDGTLSEAYVVNQRHLRSSWVQFEKDRDDAIEQARLSKEREVAQELHRKTVVIPAQMKMNELFKAKVGVTIRIWDEHMFNHENTLKINAFLETQPDLVAEEPELKLVQSA